MIREIVFKNFKALRDVTLDLGKLTVVAGPNGCGKTSLLEGLQILGDLTSAKPADVFAGDRSPSTLTTTGTTELSLHGVAENRYSWTVKLTYPDGEWFIQLTEGRDPGKAPFRKTSSDLETARTGFHSDLSVFLLRFDARKLAEPSYRWPSDRFEADGSGLASVLATVAAKDPEGYARLQEDVRAIIPAFRKFQLVQRESEFSDFQPVRVDGRDFYQKVLEPRSGWELRIELHGAGSIPAHGASEGTLLTIGLLTLFRSASRPHLLLLDHLESALHPKALRELVSQLRRILERYSELQIVATTHSPYLLDHFKSEEIRLLCTDSEGFAVCGSPSDHPDYKRWKDEMAPGEFWSMVGEDWLRDKSPAKK